MTIWDCEGIKSPSLNGHNFTYIKNYWGALKFDVFQMVNEFHANGVIPRGGNTLFLALIQKVQNPQHINHFRPYLL